VSEAAAGSLANILDRFSSDPLKRDAVVRLVKKNFLHN